MTKTKNIVALHRQLTPLHRELGIPSTYAVDRQLAPCFEVSADELVEVGISDEGRPIRLIRPAAESWALMRRAAMRDDIELVALSGFRSIERQTEIFRGKLMSGEAVDDVLRYVAAPGFSEHHTGRALDIGSPEHTELDEQFGDTEAFRWLDMQATEFGFTLSFPRSNSHGIAYEPWHWCWSDSAQR